MQSDVTSPEKRQKENEEIQFPEKEKLWEFIYLFIFLHGVILKVVSLCKAEKREGSQIPC